MQTTKAQTSLRIWAVWSAFLLEMKVTRLATGKISPFLLVSVAEQTWTFTW